MSTSQASLDAFRKEVSLWLKENIPAEPDFLLPQSFMEVGTEQQLEFLREWQHSLWSAGYLGMAWPTEFGGQAADPAYQDVVDAELRRHRAPIIFNTIGLGWAGPLILDIGTQQEKERYIQGILSAEDVWCQGFSEPDHGSDLGMAQTRAVRDGDEYVINGSKIWTTMGNFARYMILLARTDTQAARKYDGLSFFLSPMHAKGIETRPIRKLTGEYGFTETFFTDARIPADCIMGEEGQGWKIAMQTLQYERGAAAGSAGGVAITALPLQQVIDMARSIQRDGKPLLEDPAAREEVVKLMIEEKALSLGRERQSIPALSSDYPFSLPLSDKYRTTEYARRLRLFALTHQGAASALYVGDDDVIDKGFWARAYMNNFSVTIGGGTSQIQANIVGEHVLGLPKS